MFQKKKKKTPKGFFKCHNKGGFVLAFRYASFDLTHVVVAIGQIQCCFVLHVPQHRVSARLAEDVGNGGVPSPHREMQGRAAIKHGGVHLGSPAEQQLHRCDVVELHGKMERRFSTRSFLWGMQMGWKSAQGEQRHMQWRRLLAITVHLDFSHSFCILQVKSEETMTMKSKQRAWRRMRLSNIFGWWLKTRGMSGVVPGLPARFHPSTRTLRVSNSLA